MSGGKETTTTTSNAEPWADAQPALRTAIGGASDIYDAGTSFAPYTGDTVVPYSDQTQAGMDSIQSQSEAGMGQAPNTTGFLSDLLSNGSGLSQQQQDVAGQYKGVAAGNELYGQNPAFQRYLQQAQGDVGTNVDLSTSGAGRYGSGQHTDVKARAIGNMTDRMLTDEYGRQLGRQDAARGNLANLGQQGLMNQFGAAEAYPTAWNAQFAPEQSLMGIGGMQEDLSRRNMGDDMRLFQEQQRQPLSQVEWLNSIASGAGSLGGNQTQSQIQPGTNPFVQALGYGLGANNLLDNPLGTALGGILQ